MSFDEVLAYKNQYFASVELNSFSIYNSMIKKRGFAYEFTYFFHDNICVKEKSNSIYELYMIEKAT